MNQPSCCSFCKEPLDPGLLLCIKQDCMQKIHLAACEDMARDKDQPRCVACMRVCPPGSVACDNASCQDLLRQMHAAQAEFEAADLHKAVQVAIQRRCKDDDEWSLGRAARWFYTVKVLLCVWLGWQRNFKRFPVYEHPTVVAAQHHYSPLYAGWESRTLLVGKGVFCRWWYEIESDGDWSM